MVSDMIAAGLEAGWKVTDASKLDEDLVWETDVVIIGSGAGGGICAEALSQAGLDLVIVEEGPLKSSRDFKMRESEAYPDLYQESAARKTKDKAITILQGRCVGGGTTVNWTSSFATPDPTLTHWATHHEVKGASPEEMAPWFERARQRLKMAPWSIAPNANNEILRRGAHRLGWSAEVMHRNVHNCANLGYCGMGCPLNAKQSMLVTTIPTALATGARLLTRTRAVRLEWRGGKVNELLCDALDDLGVRTSGRRIRIRARHFIVAGGAIGSPALLLRSKVPDPFGLLGRRTFLHPVPVSAAVFSERVEPYSGAPQSIYSDQFLWWDGADGRMGYKMEVPPLHPLLTSTAIGGHGKQHYELFSRLPFTQALLSLLRDGFHEQSAGGRVHLRSDGSPLLDYPFTDYLMDGMRHSLLSMAELQFAAGALEVVPMHRRVQSTLRSWAEAKTVITALSMAPLEISLFSAHVMGGCPMSESDRLGVVDSLGRHHQLENLSVIDGSVFPTSIGSNPQLSIYGLAMKNVSALIARLTNAT